MAKFGDWQRFLDASVGDLKDDQKGLLTFMKTKTDEERILFVSQRGVLKKRWIENFFEDIRIYPSCKSSVVAAELRRKGNMSFEKKQFPEALCCYNECVMHAPLNDGGHELSLGYANRSAVLYHLGNYRLCLNDIQSALDCGYPDDLTYKLILRRGQCLLHSLQWEKAKSEITIAREKFLEQSQFTAKKKASFLKEVEELLLKVDQRPSTDIRNLNTDDGLFVEPAPVCGFNSTLKQASSSIDMRCSLDKGRHLVANQQIKAGEVLIVEQPYAAVLLPSHYATNCHHCFNKVMAVTPCYKCTSVIYCSVKCQKESWTCYHFIECPMLDLLHSVGIAHLSLRVILVTQLQHLLAFREDIRVRSDNGGESMPGMTSEGSYECNYLSVYNLLPHSDDMIKEDLYQYAMTATLLLLCLERSSFFDSLSNKQTDTESPKAITEAFSEDDNISTQVKLFIGGLLLRHICQLVCNAHAITDLELSQFSESSLVDTQSQVRIATAIYPTVSLMNHSCDPTIISSFYKKTLIVRACKDVALGEEIFNCYGPHCKRMTRSDRLQHLREQYFFDCQCEPCITEQKQELYFQALKCKLCKGPVVDNLEDSYSCMTCGDCPQNGNNERNILKKSNDLFAQGLGQLNQHQIDDALTSFNACFAIRKSRLYALNKDLAEVHDVLAKCYAIKGDFLAAFKHLSKSIKISEQLFGSNSIELAHELQKYAEVCFHAGKLDDAVNAAKRSSDLFSINLGPDCEPVLELRNILLNLEKHRNI